MMRQRAPRRVIEIPRGPHERERQPTQSMSRRFIAGLAILAVTGGCANPRVQANIAQNLNDIAGELTAQRQDMSLLQDQIDSLKAVTAHQDSVIKKLLNVTGLPPAL
jgi:hypothetical protein